MSCIYTYTYIKIRIYKTIIFACGPVWVRNLVSEIKEENRLRVFEDRMLRRIFGLKRDEVTGDWRKLHNEELHYLYSSPNIIRMIKSRMRWAGHVAWMEQSGMHIGYWWESRKERAH
jgi:hypothetical protein